MNFLKFSEAAQSIFYVTDNFMIFLSNEQITFTDANAKR